MSEREVLLNLGVTSSIFTGLIALFVMGGLITVVVTVALIDAGLRWIELQNYHRTQEALIRQTDRRNQT
jgi:hypothetical protein